MTTGTRQTIADLKKLQSDRRQDRRQATTRRRRLGSEVPSQVADILAPTLKRVIPGFGIQKLDQTRAVLAWERVVGASASSFSKALRIKSGRLIVRVSDPIWMQQLLFLKRDLLKRYRREFPSVRIDDIYFTWGTDID